MKLATCVKMIGSADSQKQVVVFCFCVSLVGFFFSKGDKVLLLFTSAVLLLIVAWLFRDFL